MQIHVRGPMSKPLCLRSNRASFVNSYSSVRVRPGAPAGLWCNSSISPREGDGSGANPGFLTNFDGPNVTGYRSNKGVVAHLERAAECKFGVAGSTPACEAPYLWQHLSIEFLDGPLTMGYLVKSRIAGRADSNSARSGNRSIPMSLFVRLLFRRVAGLGYR